MSRERERIHGFWYCVYLVGTSMDIVAPHDLYASRWCLEVVALFGSPALPSRVFQAIPVLKCVYYIICVGSSVCPAPWLVMFPRRERYTELSSVQQSELYLSRTHLFIAVTCVASCPHRCWMLEMVEFLAYRRLFLFFIL